MHEDWECVVVGGGVAGLSAGLVLGRARRRTLVLDRGGQSNRPAAHVGGLLGQEGTSPDELYAQGRDQLAVYDAVVIRDAEAVDARAEGDGFVGVLGHGGREVRTRALVLATGMDYECPTSRASARIGAARCSIARSATAGRSATARSSFTRTARWPSAWRRSCADGAAT